MTVFDGSIPVSGDLLFARHLRHQTGRSVPLLMECRVNPETAPFLVSSSTSMLWVSAINGVVRAAFRTISASEMYAEVIRQVAEVGARHQWGNVHPLTPDGLLHAVAHLRSYDLVDLEILASSTQDLSAFNPSTLNLDGEQCLMLCGMPLTEAAWLPAGTLVVVPQERDLVGSIVTYDGRSLVVVHNASRGIAVCRGG